MADETAVTETPPEAEPTVLKNFGDLAEVFDKVFPATAPKKEAAPEPAKPVAEAPTAPAAPPPPSPPDELPSFLTGEKKAEKIPAPPGDPDLPPPSGKDSVGMQKLRTAYDNLIKQNQQKEAEYKAQIEAAQKQQAQPEIAALNEQLQKQVQELSAAVERGSLEARPWFRQQFVEGRQRLIEEAHSILKDSNVDAAQWDKAMALTGTARTEALDLVYEYLPRSAQNELGAIQHQVRSLDAQREATLNNHKQVNEQLTQQEQQQRYAAFKEHEKNTLQILDAAEQDLVERMAIEVYKKSDNPEHKKWNESIDKMKEDARKILLEVDDPSVMARAALLAPAAIQFRYLYHTYRDKYLEEKKKNEATTAAEPNLKSKGERTPSSGDDKLTFAEAVAREFA